jgi:hypothetical protein
MSTTWWSSCCGASGRRVDLSSPFVDATLGDGSRLHVVIPDITRRHWAVNIRPLTPCKLLITSPDTENKALTVGSPSPIYGSRLTGLIIEVVNE